MKNLIIYILTITTFYYVSCDKKAKTDNNIVAYDSEERLDSIYEDFEEIAYSDRQRFIVNPDSFLNSYTTEPKTIYQKEMYCYGLIFMAYSLLEEGDVYESIKLYEKAYDFSTLNTLNIVDLHTVITKPLSNLYTRINDTEKAIHLLENTIKNTKDTSQIPGLYNNLANAYYYNNQIDKAEKILLNTVQLTNNSKTAALLYNSLASIYNEKRDRSNSIKYNQLAIKSFEREPLVADTLLWYVSALGMYGQLHHDISYVHRANTLINESFPNTQNRLKAKLIEVEAELLKQAQDPREIDNYNKIINLFNSESINNRLDYTHTSALLGKARYYKNTSQIDSALFYYERCIENDFRTQQLITSPKDQLRNNIHNKTVVEELIHVVNSSLPHKTNPKVLQQLLWCIELSKARLLINEINRSDQWSNADNNTKNAIQKILTLYQQKDENKDQQKKELIQNQINKLLIDFQLSEKYFETMRFNPKKDQFLSNLNRDSTSFYSYFIHNNSKITIIHHSSSNIYASQITDSTFINHLHRFKSDYFGRSPDKYNENPREYQERAHSIAEKLLPNLKDNSVFISLDGDLYGLPFDALYNQGFLVNRHAFSYLNSFLLFDILETNKNDDTSISILYRSEYTLPLPSLNFVKKEVNTISRSFSSTRIGSKEYTEEVLKEQFLKSNIIHIAAHTLLDSTEAPVIFLKKPISTNQIRYFEIKSPLVFLSACNTGMGESLPAEGTESIQRVFLSKNVPSVISTYWFANDNTMLKITESFYNFLYYTKDPIKALAEAKRSYLSQSPMPHQKNPWYWANINYSGVGNNIDLKKKTSSLYLIIFIGLGAILICLRTLSRLNNPIINKFKKTNYKLY